jgi:carbamoyltransferase
VDRLRVFPHMGDGGLAIGAAVAANYAVNGIGRSPLDHLYLGPAQDSAAVEERLAAEGIRFTRLEDPSETAARLIADGEIIFWYQGRAEIGPRALGNRSILARADDRTVKDRLNLTLKRRVWYQPFCPSMLIEEAPRLLHTGRQRVEDNRFMTIGYRVRSQWLDALQGVINIDGTCRPHFVGRENPRYRTLLQRVKQAVGAGVVLNTSFNVHGDPMVHTPGDALDTLFRTGARYLILEDRLVENPEAD